MSFDLEKLQAVAELGDVIRLQNEALERLRAFRKARPYMMMPNLAKMVEENLKENVMVLYKELNNLHKPAEQQTRYVCRECNMAFISPLPGGICDECRSRKSGGGPREYVPYQESESEEEATTSASDATNDDNLQPLENFVSEDAVEDAYAASIAGDAKNGTDEVPDGTDAADAAINTRNEAVAAAEPSDSTEADEGVMDNEPAPGEPEITGTESEVSDEPKSDEEPVLDDNYDKQGDKIELANPAPAVAEPEGVEGIPDTSLDEGAADERKS